MRKSVHSDPQTVFQELLKQARLKADLTQQTVANRLGRPQSFVAKYEGGERRLDVVEFVTIGRILRVDPVALLRRLIKEADL